MNTDVRVPEIGGRSLAVKIPVVLLDAAGISKTAKVRLAEVYRDEATREIHFRLESSVQSEREQQLEDLLTSLVAAWDDETPEVWPGNVNDVVDAARKLIGKTSR